MKPLSDLRLISLAVIQEKPQASLTRYQVMSKINHILHDLQPPYSPGAVYHDLKLAAADRLIIINHNAHVTITPEGLRLLHYELMETPMPVPLFSILTRILATLLLYDQAFRAKALQKLQIEMIKYSQNTANSERQPYGNNVSPDTWTLYLSETLRKSIQSFVAQI